MLAATMLATLAATAQAKTLVYCSEGSPENFSPMLNTTGTTFDANAPIYNTLVQFKRGTTEIEPGLAEKWEVSADGKTYTFHLRQNAQWQSNKNFKPSRGVTADDVIFSFERQWKDNHPFHAVNGGAYSYFGDMAFPKLLAAIDKVDDHTVKFTLTKPNAPFLADLAMDFASIMSKLRRRPAQARQAGADRPGPDRLRPLLTSTVPEGRDHSLSRVRRLLGQETRHRHAGLLHHQRGRHPPG